MKKIADDKQKRALYNLKEYKLPRADKIIFAETEESKSGPPGELGSGFGTVGTYLS